MFEGPNRPLLISGYDFDLPPIGQVDQRGPNMTGLVRGEPEHADHEKHEGTHTRGIDPFDTST